MADIAEFLKKRAEDGLLRSLTPIDSRRSGRLKAAGREYIDFSSNDYLGLSEHPALIEAAKAALDEFGAGTAASRLLGGSLAMHHRLEKEIALFKNKESALIFNSGYQANIGIISSLYSKGDVIFSDKLNHASIMDGISLSGSALLRFFHNDTDHLETLLKNHRRKFKKALIITETIFSMNGDRPPLKKLADLKDKYDCRMMVDEAHATGVYGKNGSGVVEEEGLSDKVDFIMGTFGKALGSFGAYIAASTQVTDYLVNACRSFIYSTSLPPAVIACNLAGLELVRSQPARRQKLLGLAEYFRSRLKGLNLDVRGSSQIVPVVTGRSDRAEKIASALREKGYWVLPIRPPTVPAKEARLRFSLTCHHDENILCKLVKDISNVRI